MRKIEKKPSLPLFEGKVVDKYKQSKVVQPSLSRWPSHWLSQTCLVNRVCEMFCFVSQKHGDLPRWINQDMVPPVLCSFSATRRKI